MTQTQTPDDSPLGKDTQYVSSYMPDLLFPIARKVKREEIGIDSQHLPFYGFDLWNHYEVSWLNEKGKPEVALIPLIIQKLNPKKSCKKLSLMT